MRAKPPRTRVAAQPWTALRDSVFGVVMAATALAAGAATAGDENLLFRAVALTGDAAPGTDDGAHFESFMVCVSPSDLPPRMDADGTVAFDAGSTV